jgi:hypothetical protein
MSEVTIQWLYENDKGNGYEYYNHDVSNILEYIYIQRNIFWDGVSWSKPQPLRSEFIVPSYLPSDRFRLLFNFDEMTQTNLQSPNYTSPDPGTKRLATRGIVRLTNYKVWVHYLNDGRFDFKYVDDISTVNSLSKYSNMHLRGDNFVSPYTSTNLGKTITFDVPIEQGKYSYQCNNGEVTVEGCSLEELFKLKQKRIQGATMPAITKMPQQKIVQKAPFGDNFYVIPGTNFQTSIYQDEEGRDYFMYNDVQHYIDPSTRRAYHYDTSSSKNVWSFNGGSSIRTGKKKKQFIKRNKTYKKKRNNTRKTIKK